MRLAHFSDIHVTLSPARQGKLMGKRAAGALNYYVGGRKRHFADVEARIAELLEDIDRQNVDHAVCTGDITQMSYWEEFERCAALFGDRLHQPERYTVIPGNHDRYTPGAVAAGWYERFFDRVSGGRGEFPFRKDVQARSLVGLDVSRPTSFADSSGRCGEAQLKAVDEMLAELAAERRRAIVLLHYGFFRADGRPDRRGHALRDADALMAVLDKPEYTVDLVLHGHMHRYYDVRTARRAVICAGSATDLAHGGGYNVYELEDREVVVHRRKWDAAASAYVPAETRRVPY